MKPLTSQEEGEIVLAEYREEKSQNLSLGGKGTVAFPELNSESQSVEPAHTPLPWTKLLSKGVHSIYGGPNNEWIADVLCDADACLLFAAPMLLKALKALGEYTAAMEMMLNTSESTALMEARAAISLADGKEQTK